MWVCIGGFYVSVYLLLYSVHGKFCEWTILFPFLHIATIIRTTKNKFICARNVKKNKKKIWARKYKEILFFAEIFSRRPIILFFEKVILFLLRWFVCLFVNFNINRILLGGRIRVQLFVCAYILNLKFLFLFLIKTLNSNKRLTIIKDKINELIA